MQDITLFTSQPATTFYKELFDALEFELPTSKTGRPGFPRDAMLCGFVVMKCERFTQIADLTDYLNNNLLIAHYCGFNIMKPLPSQWTFTHFIRKLVSTELKDIMTSMVRKLCDMGIVDTSFIGLDSMPVMANTRNNNPKAFGTGKFSKEKQPRSDKDCRLGVHSAYNQTSEKRTQFY